MQEAQPNYVEALGATLGQSAPSNIGNHEGDARPLGAGDMGMDLPSWPISWALTPFYGPPKVHQASHKWNGVCTRAHTTGVDTSPWMLRRIGRGLIALSSH